MTDLITVSKLTNAPWLLLVVIFLVVASSVVRVLSESFDGFAKILGPFGRRWQRKRDARVLEAETVEELRAKLITSETSLAEALNSVLDARRDLSFLRDQRDNNAWTQDLKKQVEQLSREMTYLRHRGEMNDAYLRQDADYHRWDALGRPGDPPEYVPYVEFERRWIAAHGRFDTP